MEYMKNNGIQTSIHYPLIHKFSEYSKIYPKLELPISESIEDKVVTLPLFPGMSSKQIHHVVESVKDFFCL